MMAFWNPSIGQKLSLSFSHYFIIMSGVTTTTTTLRKSGRLATKTAIPYKEKKIPKLSKA